MFLFRSTDGTLTECIKFTEDLGLAYESQSGFYAVNGTEGEEQLLAAATNIGLNQGEDLIRAVYEDKIVLAADQGFFDDYPILLSDGTTTGTSVLHTGDGTPPSSILLEGSHAFFVYQYGFNDYRLSYINMADGTTGDIYDFVDQESSFSAFPIGVQNDKVFLAIDYRDDLGRELYSFDIDFSVRWHFPA